ncbi:uncharacterized protein LOC123548040 [Mercenaria mercenaria]|uniref:uncharacterized protein LOC123548040 n=1 Tax=Mercenaria mercenaria TaxID=6596 RepID=UPI00234F6E87|nr:uncharacterized protein LOC123548040 [Mercenaria mercenaria]
MYSIKSWLSVIMLFCHTKYSVGDSFEERAISAVSLVERNLHINACIQNASTKAKQFYPTGTRYYAVLWISMYSRDCFINKDLLPKDKENRFPYRLNKELRCQNFSQRDPHIRSIFITVSNIINDALAIFFSQPYNQLFRGVAMDWPYADRTKFVEEGFFSCSTDVNPALNFASGNILLIIKELRGVYIADYVQEKFAYQKEVLGTTVKMFLIEGKVSDEAEINTTMSKLPVNRALHPNNPKEIMYVRQVYSPSREEIDAVIKEQDTLNEAYCSAACRVNSVMLHICSLLALLHAISAV